MSLIDEQHLTSKERAKKNHQDKILERLKDCEPLTNTDVDAPMQPIKSSDASVSFKKDRWFYCDNCKRTFRVDKGIYLKEPARCAYCHKVVKELS